MGLGKVGIRVRVRVGVRARVRVSSQGGADRLYSKVDRVHVGRLPFEK